MAFGADTALDLCRKASAIPVKLVCDRELALTGLRINLHLEMRLCPDWRLSTDFSLAAAPESWRTKLRML
jgi:hypothetical protein